MTAAGLDSQLLARFAEVFRLRLGFAFNGARESALSWAILRTSENLRRSPLDLLTGLADDRAIWDELIAAVTVGETYFFRRPHHFDLIRELFLRASEPLRCWSAGCATGEEPYSLAILARECFGEEAARRVTILGTDINREFLERARRASYRAWSFRGWDEARIATYFERSGDDYRLARDIAGLVEFRACNLAQRDPTWPQGFDLILCRNVLIYFGRAEAAAAVANLASSLRDGGRLIQDATDPIVEVAELRLEREGGVPLFRRVRAREGPSPAPKMSGTRIDDAPAPRREVAAAEAEPELATTEASRARARAEEAAESREKTRFGTLAAPCGAPVATGCVTSREKTRLTTLVEMADRGDTCGALRGLHALVRETPFSADAYYLRGVIHQQRGAHKEALADANRTVMLEPTHVRAHLLRGASLLALGDPHAALRALDRARRHLGRVQEPDDFRHEWNGLWTTAKRVVSRGEA